jgi:hypothetical protein
MTNTIPSRTPRKVPRRVIRQQTLPAKVYTAFRTLHPNQHSVAYLHLENSLHSSPPTSDKIKGTKLTLHMITPIILLNRPRTPRTRLRRRLDDPPTRVLLVGLESRICPVVVLAARLALVPAHIVHDARRPLACVAQEFCRFG